MDKKGEKKNTERIKAGRVSKPPLPLSLRSGSNTGVGGAKCDSARLIRVVFS